MMPPGETQRTPALLPRDAREEAYCSYRLLVGPTQVGTTPELMLRARLDSESVTTVQLIT